MALFDCLSSEALAEFLRQVADITPLQIVESNKNPQQVIDFIWNLIENQVLCWLVMEWDFMEAAVHQRDVQILQRINVKDRPETFRLAAAGEELLDMLKVRPSIILQRWMNFHMKAAMTKKEISSVASTRM